MPRVRGGALLDPRMASHLDSSGALFPSRVTIYNTWVGSTPMGDEVELADVNKAPLAEHEALHCQIAPLQRPGVGETRREVGVLEETSHMILLPGAYPLITPKMVAKSGTGEVFDIIRCDIDAFTSFTRLETRQVTPTAIPGR